MPPEITLTPGGRLTFKPGDDPDSSFDATALSQLAGALEISNAQGLELLAGGLLQTALPPSPAFWRQFARRFFAALCHAPNLESQDQTTAPPPEPELAALGQSAPPMQGLEYLDAPLLAKLWAELQTHVRAEISKNPGGAQGYLRALNPLWNAVGRVTFHLAENKRSPEAPFAFLATYTHRVSDQGKVQHAPLGRALEEYAGAKNRAALASLLAPVQRAAEKSEFARGLLNSRAIFHPQAWTPSEAYRFLKEIPKLEESGITIRIPNWWKAGRPSRPQVSVRIGEKASSLLGKDALLDFEVELSLDGQPLTEAEWEQILKSSEGLVLLKGQWVEVDREKLTQVLDQWKKVQKQMGGDGVSLLEGMRLLAGFNPRQAGPDAQAAEEATSNWAQVTAGKWLESALEQIRNPGASAESDPGPELRAELRPYQRQGVHWLWFMNRLRLGACLADDMGLGKTIQIIALLLVLKRSQSRASDPSPPSLLIVPASLIANWKSEIQRFAPSLSVWYAHPSETSPEQLAALARNPSKVLSGRDLVITSYGFLLRLPCLKEIEWNLAILDEAQAIKNSGTRQTRAAKEIRARGRIALSGTPIENRLSDLWSLFDFLCPGLLGNARDFSAFVKSRAKIEHQPFAPLRRLVRPYILRRLKTDQRIISDLPEKTELTAFCNLSRRQALLYQQAVQELAAKLESPEIEGIQRRGLILAFLTRFKQICNHPSQWLGDDAYVPAESGKFHRLREICEEIAARQEKVLVFSQYKTISAPLAQFLAELFGRPGLVLHGETAVKKRKELVDAFQADSGPPFFILSLKAGGTGLNLTAASHVIHFDRWWNPAVENQATDRAFRIGQKRNVIVHKFVCRGTLEERIHDLITSKTALAEDILGEGADQLLTEMTNSELLSFVALDIKAAEDE